MVLSGRASVVEEYEDPDKIIRTYSDRTYKTPAVVRFNRHSNLFFKRGVRLNRKNIWLRDKGRCQYCKTKILLRDMTVDHVIPRCSGGTTAWGNIVTCCDGCNQKKGGASLAEAKMHLVRRPQKPDNLPGFVASGLSWDESMPELWKDYLEPFIKVT